MRNDAASSVIGPKVLASGASLADNGTIGGQVTPERYREVSHIYRAALNLAPEKRRAFLDETCGPDEVLRHDIESLLNSGEQDSHDFDQPTVQAIPRVPGEEQRVASLPGKKLGHYRVLSLLGRGGMGEVYLGEDTVLRRKIAIKLLSTALTIDRQRVRRFKQEAQAASALNHPNIITIHEIGQVETEVGETHYLVTEYIEGETLRQRMPLAQSKVKSTLDFAAQVASALVAAHTAGIVHRDIKPENVMVRPDGLVKVLDFGLAKLTDRPPLELKPETTTEPYLRTAPGVVMGTVSYMSPEQARGLNVDHRTDIFSLGVMIYEMIAERRPFEGSTTSDVIAALLTSEPKPLFELCTETPPGLDQLVRKCLEKAPEERYQTVQELLDDLKRLQKAVAHQTEEEPMPMANSRSSGSLEVLILDRLRRHKLAVILSVVAIVVLLSVWALLQWSRSVAIDSLAVLPFAHDNANVTNDHLGDGITESLINNLAQLPNLKVIGSSSSFSFKGKQVDPKDVGDTLGVRAVLTGRMTQTADELTISVELSDVQDRRHLWGERYSRKLGNLIGLQNEIAADVSEKLRLRLGSEDKVLLNRRQTESNDAYQLYLQGRAYLRQRSAESIRQSQNYFQQAINKDPAYALAWSGLSDSFMLLSAQGALPKDEAHNEAMKTARKAVALAPDLAEARTSLAHVLYHTNDLAGADTEYKRALTIKPNYALAHHWYAEYLERSKRSDEALAELRLALELDPLDLATNAELGFHYLSAKNYDQAVAQYQKTLNINPNYFLAQRGLAESYLRTGNYAEAISRFEKVVELTNRNRGLEGLAKAYALSGQRDKAVQIVSELREKVKQDRVSTLGAAGVYALLGNKDEAFALLEMVASEEPGLLSDMQNDVAFDGLRSDTRYADLLRRAGVNRQ